MGLSIYVNNLYQLTMETIIPREGSVMKREADADDWDGPGPAAAYEPNGCATG